MCTVRWCLCCYLCITIHERVHIAMLKWDQKSAPKIGVFTWANVKLHGKNLWKPKLSVNDISLYDSIFNPFVAWSVYEDYLLFHFQSGEMMLICVPLLTRNKYLVFEKVQKQKNFEDHFPRNSLWNYLFKDWKTRENLKTIPNAIPYKNIFLKSSKSREKFKNYS